MAEEEDAQEQGSVSDSEAIEETLQGLESESESSEGAEDEVAYIGDGDMDKHVKVKFDGDELDVPMDQVTDLVQKGLLFDKKDKDLSSKQRELDAQVEALKILQQQGQPQTQQSPEQAQQAQHIGTDQYLGAMATFLEDTIKASNNDPNVNKLANALWDLTQRNIAMEQKFNEISDWRNTTETNAAQQQQIDQGTNHVVEVMQKLGLEEDEAIDLWSEAKNAGHSGSLVSFYVEQNMDSLLEELKDDGDEGDSDSRKKASVKPAGAPSSTESGRKMSKDVSVNSADFTHAIADTLAQRDIGE